MIGYLRLLCLALLIPLSFRAQAQRSLVFEDWQEVVVFIFNNSPDLPWIGGFNSPQFSNLDIDRDGTLDLLIFDRIGNRILPLIHQGTVGQPDYRFAPEYIAQFPDLEAWVITRDYDGDGLMDLFTHHPEEGIKVYRNTSGGTDSLRFALHNNGHYIPTVRPGSASNLLKVLDIDIPGIIDLDNDGDLDIISFDNGGAFLEYHKNMSMEAYGHADSLTFVLEEACWGHVQEDGTINAMQLGVFCKGGGVPEERNRHLGGSILLFDREGDGDKEAMIGDPGFNDMIMLTNGGDSSHADMSAQTTAFPASNPVNIDFFPAAFMVDIDNNGVLDMVASTNAQGGGSTTDHIWYYNNAGTTDAPSFYFFQSDLFVGETLDFGEGANPVWVDYDHDGLLDILVANHGYYEFGDIFARLYLYRNSGTDTLPRYELITDDVAGISTGQLYNPGLYPAMGDLDGDGDEDLLLGQPNGRLDFFENISTNPNSVFPSFSLVTFGYQNIDVGSHATPQLVDVDRDGRLDLVIGEKDGKLHYYHNDGTAAQPQFSLVDENWGGVNISRAFFQPGYSHPTFYWDADTAHVLVGSEQGVLYHFASTDQGLTSAFTLLDSVGVGRNLGKRTAPATGDVDADGDIDLLVGNYAGGLNLFRQTGTRDTDPVAIAAPALPDLLTVFPNPARDRLYVRRAQTAAPLRLQLLNMQGQLVLTANIEGAETQLDMAGLAPGVYYLRGIDSAGSAISQKILISP